MSATPLFESRVNWSDWAKHAAPRFCEACKTEFQPNHPRRRFCGGPDCRGRKPAAPRQRRPSGRAQAAARAAGIQGFLGDVLVQANLNLSPTADQVGAAFLEYYRAEKASDTIAARAAVVKLCALGSARAVLLVPPRTEPIADPPGYQDARS
jgi:hypothetical protein